MNVQIYFLKKNPTVLKAERYFKERKIPFQSVDLARHALGMKELAAINQQVGLKSMIDEDSNAWKESTARFLLGEDKILEALWREPKLLRFPLIRNGRLATVGYAPDTWATWL